MQKQKKDFEKVKNTLYSNIGDLRDGLISKQKECEQQK